MKKSIFGVKNTTMKYLNILHYLFTFGLIIAVCILLLNQNKIQHHLYKHTRVKSVVEHVDYPFEERNMTLILTLIGVGFGLFALFTFGGVKQVFEAKVEEINKRYDDARDEYESQHGKLIELERKILVEGVNTSMIVANDCFMRKDWENYVGAALITADSYCRAIKLHNYEEHKEVIRSYVITIHLIIAAIEDILYKNLEHVPSVTLRMNSERFRQMVDNIGKEIDTKYYPLLGRIVDKITLDEKSFNHHI